jgi:large subunit ribosomal protein L29|tara:strand:+ start:1093 stop:1299 length:207 start_codon:yes stop_codon:yes gene_type:complete
MDKIDLNKMTKNKLIKQLSDNKESLLNLKFQQKLQQLENPLSVRFVKREIAQIKTVLKEMELNIREEK